MSAVHSEDKVSHWQLRDSQWNDEWPCLLVKVGRRSSSMNGSLLNDYCLMFKVWVQTDKPNYNSSSNEWPWEARGKKKSHHICTPTHTPTTYFHRAKLLLPLLPSWLPSMGAYPMAKWAQYLMTQQTGTLTYPLMPSKTNSINLQCTHTRGRPFKMWIKNQQPYNNQLLIRYHSRTIAQTLKKKTQA